MFTSLPLNRAREGDLFALKIALTRINWCIVKEFSQTLCRRFRNSCFVESLSGTVAVPMTSAWERNSMLFKSVPKHSLGLVSLRACALLKNYLYHKT